jgi:hypothetical protein
VFLGWQYRRLEKERLPVLEERMEQNAAKTVLERFLETGADRLLTERAMEQKRLGEYILPDVETYKILKVDKLADGEYRFLVQTGDLIQLIKVIKILGEYYIDSIQLAG